MQSADSRKQVADGLVLASQERVKVIGVLRRCPLQHVGPIAGAATSAGVRALEVTLDSSDAIESIRQLVESFPDTAVGAGTVLDPESVKLVAEAGAKFIVSPVLDPDIIAQAEEHGLACIPGAATPTEIWRAWRLGALAVKVFPAERLGGPGFVKDLGIPLGGIPLVPTGGVDASNVAQYLEAGAAAVGVGSALFPRSALEAGDVESVARRAAVIMSAIP